MAVLKLFEEIEVFKHAERQRMAVVLKRHEMKVITDVIKEVTPR